MPWVAQKCSEPERYCPRIFDQGSRRKGCSLVHGLAVIGTFELLTLSARQIKVAQGQPGILRSSSKWDACEILEGRGVWRSGKLRWKTVLEIEDRRDCALSYDLGYGYCRGFDGN